MDAFQIIRFILAAGLVLLVPGGALLAWLSASPDRSEKRGILSLLADAAALSIAIPALLALGLFVLRLQVSGIVVICLYALCLLLLLAAGLRRETRLAGWLRSPGGWVSILFSLLFVAGLIAWRFYQARTLVMPAWVDSVQHVLITRKIIEYGGIPPDLSPYLNAPFFYHYGYHLIAALFVFWSGLPIAQATLWFGQVLNALVAISVYRAAEAFSGCLGEQNENSLPGDPPETGGQPEEFYRNLRRAVPLLAAILAALLVGFDFQMPAYYLTWGRYTLLTGLLLLGPALAASLEALDRPGDRSAQVRVVLLVAGLCVTHYFALLLAGMFLIVLGLVRLASAYRSRACWISLVRLAGLVLLGILLTAPWIWRVWFYNQQIASVQMILPEDAGSTTQQGSLEYLKYLVYLIGPRRNHILLALAGLGVVAAAWQPRLFALAGWGLLLGLFTLPWGLRLGPFRPDHFAIVLFFPAALLLAELVALIGDLLGHLTHPWTGPPVVLLAAILFLAWGLRDTRNVINSATVFTNPADVAALNWVKNHTPPTARFYINSVLWQGPTYRGVDGGAWLLPETGRFSLVPPISYTWEPPEAFRQINAWAAQSAKLSGCTPDFWNLVRQANLSYVYIRKGQGGLQPEMLAGCPGLRPVYGQGGVVIYEILAGR